MPEHVPSIPERIVDAVMAAPDGGDAQIQVEPKQVSFDDFVKALGRAERRRVFDLDVRGLLALQSIIGAFALAFAMLFVRGTAEIPTWCAAMVTGVIGFYFGAKGGSERRNGH